MTAQILIVDDDPVQRRLLKAAVEREGHQAFLAENGRQGLEFIKSHPDVDVVVLDLMMPEMDGLAVLDALAVMRIDVPVIVQTGQGGIETVVRAMRAGAFDFVVKPVSPERLAMAVSNALKLEQQGEARARPGRGKRGGAVSFADIASASPDMIRVIDLARRASQSTIPVMLEGESGVGKEMAARAIQSAGERAGKPFVTVNCGAIPENLVESILFGHEKGAFTGATEKHTGKFMEADGGTLFLDEVGDLPLDIQVKLLRAVQQGEIETVGSSRVQKVNVRLISATNKDLIEEVKAGRFREDLYYRLNVFPITIPALRRRKEDIPNLVRVFLSRFSAEQRLGVPVTISAGAMALLTAYDWPGNIRQLENTIYRAVVLAQGLELTETDFPQILAQLPDFAVEAVHRPAGERHLRLIESLSAPVQVVAAEPPGLRQDVIVSTDDSGEVRTLADVEEELIRFALKFYGGQMSRVARRLGIGRSTLYRKLKDYGIDPDNPTRDVA